MTDLELLEHAAKAAVIKYNAEESKPHPKSGAFWGLWLVIHGEPSEHARRYWNPLTDDGDALRLAVKLRICLGPNLQLDRVVAYAEDDPVQSEPYDPNPYAATRRAIVRAAAEMAKATSDNIA